MQKKILVDILSVAVAVFVVFTFIDLGLDWLTKESSLGRLLYFWAVAAVSVLVVASKADAGSYKDD